MLKLPVILAVDRAGLVGEDGETHHGIYDIGFLRHAPGMRILCPASLAELRDMLLWAAEQKSGPVAIRYPRGGNGAYTDSAWLAERSSEENAVCVHRAGGKVAFLTYGTLVNRTMEAAQILSTEGIDAAVIRLTTIAPLPVVQLTQLLRNYEAVFIPEEAAGNCGIHESLAFSLQKTCPGLRIYGRDLGNCYVQHGSVDKLYEHYGFSGRKLADYVKEVFRHEN